MAEQRLVDVGDLLERMNAKWQSLLLTRTDGYTEGYLDAYNEIENLCTVDPQIHGHWETDLYNNRFFRCSKCGHLVVSSKPNYCEECGAKMDESKTVDTVHVVRCKDCHYFHPYDHVEDFDGKCEATDESHLVHIGTPKSPKFKCTACGEVCYCYQAKNRQKAVCDYKFCPHCGKNVKEKEG